MNSVELVIDFIARHPGASAKSIMHGTGLGPYALRHVLAGLAARDLIRQTRSTTRPLCWWPCHTAAEREGEHAAWYQLREKAQALERKGFWHRAAGVWLQALDATAEETLRHRAARHRTRCLQRAARRGEPYDGIAIAAVEGIDTWGL